MTKIDEANELKRLGLSGFINQYYPMTSPRGDLQTWEKILTIKVNDSNLLEGINACIKKEYKDALNYFNGALKNNGHDYEALLRKGLVLFQLEKFEEALAVFQDLLSSKKISFKFFSHTKNENDAYIYYLIGFMYKDLKEKIKSYNKSIKLDPGFSYSYSHRARAFSSLYRYEEAINDYSKVIELNPCDNVHEERARIFNFLERYEDAINDCKQAIKLNPKSSTSHALTGLSLYKIKQYEKSIEAFDQAIKLNKNPYYYRLRGDSYFELKDYVSAFVDFEKATELNPKDKHSYTFLAEILMIMKEYEKAIINYDKLIDLDPSDTSAYTKKYDALIKLGLREDALNCIKKSPVSYDDLIKLDPKDIRSYIFRARNLIKLGNIKEALSILNSAIELDPKNAEAYKCRGQAFYDLKWYEDAIKDYSKAIKLDPEDAETYKSRGHAFYYLDKNESAISDYSRAIKLDPEDAEAYKYRGDTFFYLDKYEDAINDLGKLDPKNSKSYKFLSGIDKIDTISLFFNLGCCYHNLGHRVEADLYYRRVLAIDLSHFAAKNNLLRLKDSY